MNELKHYGILGMRWGVRRYRNKDGSLTPKGKARYDRDIKENLARKKDNRIDTSNPDPNRWVKEDLERTKRVVDLGSNLTREASNIERETRPKPIQKRMDLSKMTDKEMRERINRELLEQQYNKLFVPEEKPRISKGRQYTRMAIDIVGGVLTTTSSALAIALAIKELKGGK